MAFQAAYSKKKGTGKPLPKRGQIKAKIFRDLFRSVLTIVSNAGENARRRKGGKGRSPSSVAPSPSSHISYARSDA